VQGFIFTPAEVSMVLCHVDDRSMQSLQFATKLSDGLPDQRVPEAFAVLVERLPTIEIPGDQIRSDTSG